jgi:hypothetical protein
MKNMDIFIRAERDGSMSLMSKSAQYTYLTFNSEDEAVDFSVRMIKFVGSLEYNEPYENE